MADPGRRQIHSADDENHFPQKQDKLSKQAEGGFYQYRFMSI